MAKSFHLRALYVQHGFKENNKAYRFFKNLYDYEEREALLIGKSKIDKETRQYLNGNQKVFRRQDNSYFYRIQEKLIGQVANPLRLSKNYRLGTRSLNSLPLLSLAYKDQKKEAVLFKSAKLLQQDFQQFIITRLLLMCKSAEFVKIPLEQE